MKAIFILSVLSLLITSAHAACNSGQYSMNFDAVSKEAYEVNEGVEVRYKLSLKKNNKVILKTTATAYEFEGFVYFEAKGQSPATGYLHLFQLDKSKIQVPSLGLDLTMDCTNR